MDMYDIHAYRLTPAQYEKWLQNPLSRDGYHWRDNIRYKAKEKAREAGCDKVQIRSPDGALLDFFE